MPELTKIIIIYLVAINVLTFFMYGVDKWKAKQSKWRIREAALLMLAALGGSIGAWLGMHFPNRMFATIRCKKYTFMGKNCNILNRI